jgi:hypothetical protein
MAWLKRLKTWIWLGQSQAAALLFRRITVRLTGAAIAAGGITLMGFGTIGSPVISNGTSLVDAGGNNNAGDFFLDGISLGPGGEHDPHLGCPNSIIVGGKDLADSSGTFNIFGWPPSGSMEDLLDGTWHYTVATTSSTTTVGGGTQTIAIVSTSELVAAALNAGDTPQQIQGLHFKFQVNQDPVKFKTFWLDCVVGTTTTSSSTTSGAPAPPSTTSTTTGAVPGTPISTPGVGTGALGVTTKTPSTGADVEFGLGLGLVIGGAAMAVGAGPLFRRKKK